MQDANGPQAVEALRDALLAGPRHLPLSTLRDAANQLTNLAAQNLLAPTATHATRPLLELLAELRERSNLARLAHAHLAPEMCALIRLELDADEWARHRLDLMLASEPPALLLEALVPILQNRLSAGAAVATAGPPPPPPAAMLSRCKQLLSRTVRRPGGAHALLVRTCQASAADPGSAAAASIVRLLASIPQRTAPAEYLAELAPQILSLLDPPLPDVQSPSNLAAREAMQLSEQEVELVHFVRACAARLAGLLHAARPHLVNELLLAPLLAPLLRQHAPSRDGEQVASDELGADGLTQQLGDCDDQRGADEQPRPPAAEQEERLALERLHAALCLAPPSLTLCDALLKAGVLPGLLEALARPLPRADPTSSEPFQMRKAERARDRLVATARQLLSRASSPAADVECALLAATTPSPPHGLGLTDVVLEVLRADECASVHAALVEALLSRALSLAETADTVAAVRVPEQLWACLPKLLGSARPDHLAPLIGSERVLSLLARLISGAAGCDAAPDSDDDDEDGDAVPPKRVSLAHSDLVETGLRLAELLLEPAEHSAPLARALARELLAPLRTAFASSARSVAERAAALSVSILCMQQPVEPRTARGGEAADEAEDLASLREAMSEVVGAEVPLRARGLDVVRKLLARRSAAALSHFGSLVTLFERAAGHPDSYVYQSAFNALTTAAEVRPLEVFPRLAAMLRPSSEASGAADDAERRLKAAQAVCQAAIRLGDALPPHAEAVMHALLVGARDGECAIRASSIACLASVCPTLRFALHPWAVEVLECVESSLVGEPDEQVRQATLALLAALVKELGADALKLLPARQLRRLYVRARAARDDFGEGALTRQHAGSAVEMLDHLGRALVGGPPQLHAGFRKLRVL